MVYFSCPGAKIQYIVQEETPAPRASQHPESRSEWLFGVPFSLSLPKNSNSSQRANDCSAAFFLFMAMALEYQCCAVVIPTHWSSARAAATLTALPDLPSLRLLFVDQRAPSSTLLFASRQPDMRLAAASCRSLTECSNMCSSTSSTTTPSLGPKITSPRGGSEHSRAI